MKRKILFAEKHLDIPSFKNHSAWDMTKMVRDISKLNKIIKEHVHDGIKNLKSYSNNILFEEIFNAYNKDLPLCYNINNNVKNRKMVFNKIKRLWKKSSENVEKSNISDMSIMFDKLNEFESTKINSKFEVENNELGLNDRQLNDDENCALDALLSLCENEEIPDLLNTNSQINSNEKCALDVLLSICEVKDDLHRTINEDDMCILESLMRLYEDTENFKMESKVINTEEKVYESLEDNNCNDIIFKGANESHCKNIELCLNELKSEVKGMFDYLKQILPIIVNSCSLEKNNTNLINFDNCSVEKVDNKINNIKKINKEKDNFIDTFTLKEDVFTSKNNEDINSCNINEVYDEVVENTTTYNNLSKIEASNKKDYVLQSNGNSFNNTKNVKNKTATLGPFETTGSSLELSKFEKYRKVPNPKEQLNKSVKRLDGNSSKNVRKFKKKFLDSEFEINPKLIFEAEDDPKLNLTKNKFVLDVIRQEYLKINNTCIVSFFSTKNLKSGILVYGYCSFPDCVNYRFSINLSGNVSVYRSGEICHAKGEERVSQMRGVTRKIVKKELKNKSAYLYRKEQILNAADEVAESGNFQNIQKLSTLRKCRSEALLDDCYDPDPFIDVFLMQQSKYKNYIQHVASPLTVYCWEEATFETFAKNPQILKDANYTIHFDASGQSVRQIMIAEKRILVYKIVIRIKKFKMVFPIVTAILSRHTLNDICGILEKLKTFCIQHKYKWPFFQRVCTDFSYALIGAVLKCCNDSNVSEYLQVCFNYLENPKNKKPKVFIQLCKSHYAHTISHDLNNKIGKKKSLALFTMECFGFGF